MIHKLWKFFLEDDVDSFRHSLARATYTHGSSRNAAATSSPSLKIGSPGSLGTSPRTPKQKRGISGTGASIGTKGAGWVLTRSDINKRDAQGRTLLHHAASSQNGNALDFVLALLDTPLVDLYIQDSENGWTALHRALYFGNVDVAHALMRKDIQNVTDFASGTTLANHGGLVKIKDFEGNSPFEVFGLTIAPRLLKDPLAGSTIDRADEESVNSIDVRDEPSDRHRTAPSIPARVNLGGDEVFAFGSNSNLSLGLGDEDDRQFPERIHLERPRNLLQRLAEDYAQARLHTIHPDEDTPALQSTSASGIPAVVENQAIVIQDIIMSKMHTAVLTDDPVSNLFVCGFGPGGRLGTGDETTRFNYVSVQGGGIGKRKVTSIALGRYHTLAICLTGEVFTWGSNKYGQLGYTLPETSSNDVPMQLTPRQLYGLIKKEQIVGCAASSIHSVIYSANAMFTFGKNEGQLGLVDADARSLESQVIPRRVGTSILQSPIRSISAIDRATSVLMENNDVIVFTQYAWKKVIFPLEESNNALLTQTFSTSFSRQINSICKVTSGGNTICAISTYGQVFTVEVPPEAEQVAPNVSTTNPNKARNALPPPSRVWSIGKPHMAAIDAAVDQDGSIILCTNSGSVWRKEKRAKIKSIHHKTSEGGASKDYKFVRVPNLTRAIAVRSNAFGAFTVVRRDADVTRVQLLETPATLWSDMFPLLAFKNYGHITDSEEQESALPQYRFWVPKPRGASPATIRQAILTNPSAEDDFIRLAAQFEPLSESPYDVWVTSTVTEVKIPVHSFLLKARSSVLRSALGEMEEKYFFSIADILTLEYGSDGCVRLNLQGADFLTLINLVLYLYSDNIVDVWHYTSRALQLAPRYRQVRVELMKIAAALDMRSLERAARVMVPPVASLRYDFEQAYQDLDFWHNADVIIDLAEGAETPAHSTVLSMRCPFFEGLFHGRAGGMWMSSRSTSQQGAQEPVRVDLKHIEENIFLTVLRHLYADTDDEIFDDIVTQDVDEFIDLVIEVMSVANELMLDRLAQICQKIIGRYVTTRNVCGLLNTVAECSVNDFKKVALEYICLNLESMLDSRLLDELDEDLLEELNETVRANQLSFLPFVRSGRFEAELLEQYPQLIEDMERDQQRRVDYMRLPARVFQDEDRITPKRKIAHGDDELPFAMDEDGAVMSPSLRGERASPSARPGAGIRRMSHLALSTSFDVQDNFAATSAATDQSSAPDVRPQQSPAPLVTSSGFHKIQSGTGAWKVVGTPATKTDFKSIMDQSTGQRVSNLTQQMAAASASSPSTSTKMSQKERKRQQQEARKQEIMATTTDWRASSPSSPWTKVAPPTRRTVSSPLSEIRPVESPTQSVGTPVRPNMTMRQTVSGVANQAIEVGQRAKRPSQAEATSPEPPTIQSIRHTPLPVRAEWSVDAHTSMADILAQQQGEKLAIKEAVAKRSLQEIQQEQEFQAWWDQESRRIQEEEARAVQIAKRQSKAAGTGHRGGRKADPARGGNQSRLPTTGTPKASRSERVPRRKEGTKTGDEASAPANLEGNNNPATTTATPTTTRRRGLGKRRERGKPRNVPVANNTT